MPLSPAILETPRLILRPLAASDAAAMCEAVKDGELWKLKTTIIPSPEEVEAYIALALTQQKQGNALPFAIILKDSERLVGCTRYMNIEMEHLRLEIGTTWLSRSVQRSFVNTEAKFLLLEHAFDVLGCNAVEFRTDRLNTASRAAIARLGAKQDGILRHHRIMPDGRLRDTVVFSILKEEWPDVRSRLLERI